MLSLQRRSLRGNMIEVYNMLNGLDKVDAEKLFARNVNGGRGHSFNLLKKDFDRSFS